MITKTAVDDLNTGMELRILAFGKMIVPTERAFIHGPME